MLSLLQRKTLQKNVGVELLDLRCSVPEKWGSFLGHVVCSHSNGKHRTRNQRAGRPLSLAPTGRGVLNRIAKAHLELSKLRVSIQKESQALGNVLTSDDYVVVDWPRGTLGRASAWEFWSGHDDLQASCEAPEGAS